METSSTSSSSTSSSDSSSTSWVSWSSASIPTSSGQGPSLSPAPDCQDWTVPDLRSPGTPSSLRQAPPATTPLPGSFVLTEDESTKGFDDGTVVLGGSPLHLFRIS